MRRAFQIAWIAAAIGFHIAVATAQTSSFSSIAVAGSFNGFSTTAHPMTLVSNYLWQADIALPATNRIQFLFVTNGGFGTTWKIQNQSWFGPWLAATAAFNAGVDIVLSNVIATAYRFTFHETTRAFRVEQRYTNAVSWTSRFEYVCLAGTFNGFNTLIPNMRLISNGLWQAYVSFNGATGVYFLFATRFFSNTWKDVNQSAFTIPMSGQAEFNVGNDIVIDGRLIGTFRFQFDEFTGHYLVEDVTALAPEDMEPWINEIHYDNAGADTNEFVEIAGPAGLSLTNYQITLYNGSGGAPYSNRVLAGSLPNQTNGFGAVAFFYPPNGIQNGDPDGVALSRLNPPKLIEFISYGGTFTAVGGPADGAVSVDMRVKESNSTPVGFSLQRVGTGFVGSAFAWTGPLTNSAGQMNLSQRPVFPASPAFVALSNLTHVPASPSSTDAVHILVSATAGPGASNLHLTAFYRINSNGNFVAQPMAWTGGAYRTIDPVPPQTNGSRVEYYAVATFRGPGTNSPVRVPTDAPTNAPFYGISAVPAGRVWINEINPGTSLFEPAPFIELAGWAGVNLSGWRIRLFDVGVNVAAEYVLPSGSILAPQMSGHGFYVLAPSNVAPRDLTLTQDIGGGLFIPLEGGIELQNEFGMRHHAVWYGTTGAPPGFSYIYFDWLDSLYDDASVGYWGTGDVLGAFALTNLTPTIRSNNVGQTFVGGNTNPIPPLILCPSNIHLSCPSSPVPPPNTASVTVVNYCLTGSVMVTHAGDVTNSGTGCYGNPRIITRTYQAVSCGATSTCQQLIIIEDGGPPSMSLLGGTQTLVNAGFEAGTLAGWQRFGPESNRFFASIVFPYEGFSHGVYETLLDSIDQTRATDSSGNELHGQLWGSLERGLTPPNAVIGKAYRFNGTDAYVEIPYSPLLNHTTFTVSVWARWLAPTNHSGFVFASYSEPPRRGYYLLGTNGVWQFVTGQGGAWHTLAGPSIVSGQWVHLVGAFSGSTKRFYVNGSLVGQATHVLIVNTTRVARIGAGGVSHAIGHFRGTIDDVQIYDRALSDAEIASLYNAGAGGPTGANLRAHYKLDEDASAVGFSSGLSQALSAAGGQNWTLSGYLAHPNDFPLQGQNRVVLELQYLNSATVLLAAVTSQPLLASSPKDAYLRFSASGVAPSNTAWAQAVIRYIRDSEAAGRFYFDSIALSRFTFDPGTNCTFNLPDLRMNVSASDPCGVLSTNQAPAPGTPLAPGNHTVTFTAMDPCGQMATNRITVSVEDNVPPVIVVSNITVECGALVTPWTGVTVLDCSAVNLFVLSDSVSGGIGCPGDPLIVTRQLQAVDMGGRSAIATQIITQRLTSAPMIVCSATGALANPSFEIGTQLTNWSRFGNTASSADYARTGGVRSARISGLFNNAENYSGVFQDLDAREGQHWRAAAWLLIPTNNPISGSNEFRLKLEFLNTNGHFVGVMESRAINSADVRGVFFPVSVQGVAPSGTRWARIAGVYVQRANAPGEIYMDDASLNMTTFTAGTNGLYALPEMTALWANSNPCAEVSVWQSPISGTLLPIGVSTVQLVAVNQCGFSSTCFVSVVVIDETPSSPPPPPPPTNVVVVEMSVSAAGITVRSLGTNSWSVAAEYATNLLGSQQWWTVPALSNHFVSGTNVSLFQPPVTNTPIFFRIWQIYP